MQLKAAMLTYETQKNRDKDVCGKNNLTGRARSAERPTDPSRAEEQVMNPPITAANQHTQPMLQAE